MVKIPSFKAAVGNAAHSMADTKPDFSSDEKDDEKQQRQNSAASNLSNAENNAVNSELNNSEDSVDGTREAENDPEFTNSVTGGDDEGGAKKPGLIKRKGAAFFITLLLFLTGGLSLGAQSMMPFSLAEQLRTSFDSISASTTARTNVFFKKQLNHDPLKDTITQKYFGFGGQEFKVSNKQKAKLESEGIYMRDVEIDGKTKTVMVFDDGTDNWKIVTPDADTAAKLKAQGGAIDINGKTASYADALDFGTKYNGSSDFRNGYIKSSKTWRGAIGAWFDSIAVKFLQSNSITRNRFKDFQERVKAEQEGNTRMEAMKSAMDPGREEMNIEGTDRKFVVDGTDTEVSSEIGEDGKPRYFYKDSDTGKKTYVDGNRISMVDADGAGGTKIKTKGATKSEVASMMVTVKDSAVGKATSKATGIASGIANIGCLALSVVGSVQLLVAAQEGIQVINLVSGYLEAIDKVKAGDGNDSPINEMAESLITPRDTTREVSTNDDYDQYRSVSNAKTEEYLNDKDSDIYSTKTETVRTGMSAMQSSGIASLYTGDKVNSYDESVENFSIGSRLNTIMGRIGSSAKSFTACAIAKLSAAAVGFTGDLIEIIACAVTFGAGCVYSMIKSAVVPIAVSVSAAGIAAIALKYVVPLAVRAFTTDLISDIGGEDFGNALVSGANMYMGTNHLSGGGSLGTWSAYSQFKIRQDQVIAENARYERETRSPFDITSEYTFFGSLLKQVVTLSTIKSAPMSIISGISSMLSNSVSKILPTASAIDIATTLPSEEEYEQTCPFLASIGAVGDAYCNPYIISDMSTIEDDPVDVVEAIKDDNLNDDGAIKKNSNLAKYIMYCSGRSSSFGVADNNIAGNFTKGEVQSGSEILNTVSNAVIGAIPLIGDGLDIASNQNQLDNMGWISGESCVAGNAVSGEAPDWGETRYYQRYVEDQRLLESMDDDYVSTVSVFLDEYYEENPLDNSYEGILARRSGLTKDTVVALLDFIEYQDYIANYNPVGKYEFVQYESQDKIYIEDSFRDIRQIAIIFNNEIQSKNSENWTTA